MLKTLSLFYIEMEAEMNDAQFKRDMVSAITALRGDMEHIRSSVDDMKLLIKKQGQLLQYAHVHLPCYRLSTIECESSLDRDHASSLMSMREIEEDYIGCRMSMYQEGGDCRLAAAEAYGFFNRCHKLMHAKLVDAVLYAPSGKKPVMRKPQITPPEQVHISPIMKRFKLQKKSQCIWVLDGESHDVKNVLGASHRVTLVTTLEGDRVVVDWGIGQFSDMPDDMRLFIPQNDM